MASRREPRARGRCPATLPYAIAVAARRRGGAPTSEPGLEMKKTAVMGRRLARDAAWTQRRQLDWRRRAREGLGSRRHGKFHQAPAGAYAAAVRRREGNSTAITANSPTTLQSDELPTRPVLCASLVSDIRASASRCHLATRPASMRSLPTEKCDERARCCGREERARPQPANRNACRASPSADRMKVTRFFTCPSAGHRQHAAFPLPPPVRWVGCLGCRRRPLCMQRLSTWTLTALFAVTTM